ncbi:VOC family protein [Kitasatospora mediocidica]|uniref:VOC family protein n=1 Tax=Kitasatospora mediocidica TaxID=58352 RepID=UPI0005619374|nr:VOC family protein [Kitasatospora mediocidica]
MLSTDFTTGAPSWLDVASPDTAASAAFYTAVFGWTFESAGPEADGFGFFQKDGKTLAALGRLTEEGASPAWTVYFQTPDADATTKAAVQHGGTVRAEPFDVMDAGRMSCLTDPGGAQFAVWQPATFKGLEKASEHDTLCWAELHVADPAGVLAFYRALFGWRSQEMAMPGMTYTVLSTAAGDQQDASFGGLAGLQEGMKPLWIPYFDAAETDAVVARVRENGGSVLMPAADVPEVGRMAWLADPFGAPFAVITPRPPSA